MEMILRPDMVPTIYVERDHPTWSGLRSELNWYDPRDGAEDYDLRNLERLIEQTINGPVWGTVAIPCTPGQLTILARVGAFPHVAT